MKRLVILFLASIVIPQFAFSKDTRMYDDDKEYVKIDKERESDERERSLVMAECYLDRDSNTLELEYAGIGIPVVYICDFYGNIQSSQCATAGFGKVVLDLPSGEGMYHVVVQSNTYRGSGVFQIY